MGLLLVYAVGSARGRLASHRIGAGRIFSGNGKFFGWHIGLPVGKCRDMPTPAVPPGKRRLEEEFREALRVRGCSFDTERSYWMWTRQYIFFHGKRHPREMGVAEVQAFLNHLAVNRKGGNVTEGQRPAAI